MELKRLEIRRRLRGNTHLLIIILCRHCIIILSSHDHYRYLIIISSLYHYIIVLLIHVSGTLYVVCGMHKALSLCMPPSHQGSRHSRMHIRYSCMHTLTDDTSTALSTPVVVFSRYPHYSNTVTETMLSPSPSLSTVSFPIVALLCESATGHRFTSYRSSRYWFYRRARRGVFINEFFCKLVSSWDVAVII